MSFWLMTCKNGYLYSKEWPQIAELNAVFVENKVIKLTLFAQKACPVVAVCGAWVQYSQLGAAHLPMIFTLMLAILSMPLQGFYWLGKRAETQLPPSLSSWYHQVRQKMQESGLEPKTLQGQPRYLDLARLLKQAFAQLDSAFIRQWL
ncbi:terminus macrodomain insulation protein YfbV [Rheinheimera sp.]|uniref:terminus macrodomain insulation protein YfbV n=1 Tax=Rheinheimera sp. TaxID=1869214 RepID=UPI003AF80D52